MPARPQKVENVPNELGNQAEISRPSTDSWLLVAHTTEQERDKLKEGLLNKKKKASITDGLEISQTLQVTKDAKIKKWLQGKDKIRSLPENKTKNSLKMKLRV